MQKSKKEVLLERGLDHIFSTGINDAASHMCRINMKYGLAGMHCVQKKFGMEENATFISSPDETVTRNVMRWNKGISYGGKISWGNGKEKVVILDAKPNTCGMLVGGLNKIPKPIELLKKITKVEGNEDYINGIKVKWDFYKGNHFIDLFEVDNKSRLDLPKYAVIFHAGCPELKGDNKYGGGLYWNKSKYLQERYEEVKTPFNTLHVLVDGNARDYLEFYKKAEEFSNKRRELMFKKLFENGNIMMNICHQGLINYNEMMLGCQIIERSGQLFPISIRADLPSYIMKGKKNFSKEKIEELGFKERSEEYGVYNRLRNANILPHGGGYEFLDSLTIDKVFEVNGVRYYEIETMDGVGKKIVSDVRELQFSYRSREVILKTLEVGMGEIAAELTPVYTLKI